MEHDLIRFSLNGEIHEVRGEPPVRTVLQYLRQSARLTGTKEGCAEGDCGACTVVQAELDEDGRGLRYRAVNSCIQFLPTLHGKALITVEGVSHGKQAAHPVQEAMVDHHGSQCGFCTPGFVMSLYAMHQASRPTRPADKAAIDCALAGNLCRCTGYRPIVDAALAALTTPPDAAFEAHLLKQLKSMKTAPLVLDGPQTKWFTPATETELAQCLAAHPDARIVAGTTDVGLWATKQLRTFSKLVYVGGVASLKRIRHTKAFLEIGAAVSWTDAMPALIDAQPDMRELLERFASPPVRNAGTVGGNIANGSPIGDSMPAFIALGGELVLKSSKGERVMALDAFYLGYQKNALAPGEYVAALRLPQPKPGQVFRTYKLSKRFDQDISAVAMAIAIQVHNGRIEQARIAYGGMAAIPQRARHTEVALIGSMLAAPALETARAALDQDFQPIADMRASVAYRVLTAKNLLTRFFLEANATTGAKEMVRLNDLEEAL
ncbi:MAG TPA: xanthine dehydrogenase small subunit [Burkholderiales bacterium]|nr:xanthine dehydrogenase small subunit [Burkholderiales bacterium]